MKINAYLNFPGTCEAAFTFYHEVLGGSLSTISRFGEVPSDATEASQVSEEEQAYVMHVGLVIGDDVLMGSDVPLAMHERFAFGNGCYVSLHPATLEEATTIFTKLSAGGEVEVPLAAMFWGAHFGAFRDKFGILWMIHFDEKWNGSGAQYPTET